MNPADKIEQWPIDRLIPYARNSRTHSDQQVAQIAASIKEWGWTTPVLVDEAGQIIAGHGRIMAARKLGMAEVPVVIASGWSDAQKRAYVIADNKLALNAGWDNDLLALEFGELEGLGFDLELTGFSLDEIDALKPVEVAAGLTDEDEVPEVPADPVTRLGDVWLLGRHRLMCGDSTSIDAVEQLMAGQKADLCFTSPPYGNQRDYTTNGISDWDNLMQGVFSIIPMQESGQILINLGLIHKGNEWVPYWDEWIQWMRTKGWKRFGWYVWDQGPGLPGDWNGRLAPSHEFVFHFNKKAKRPEKTEECKYAGVTSHGTGLRAKDGECKGYSHNGKAVQDTKIADSVFRVNRHKARGIECDHPAVYPVDLPIKAMQMWPGVCYEPFSGSGTTIISAEKLNRICYAMELSPQYVDIAIKRWQDFTGKQATLEATGQTFAEVSNGKASQAEAV